MQRRELLALPNVLSFSRLLLAIAFPMTQATSTRVALVCVAAITDFLDGFLARRLHTSTPWGALIDPISDRAFALTAVTTLLVDGALTPLQYVIIIARDLMTALGFLIARLVRRLRAVPFKARRLGKVVTSLQFVTFLAALVRPSWVEPLVVAVGVASVWAIADYTHFLWRARARAATG